MNLPWTDELELSPYLNDPSRLADVIAAIQAMGTYRYYKLNFAGWADRISADVSQADKWEKIFLEHPEFFRLDSAREKASLVWRRQFPKRYDARVGVEITRVDYDGLDENQRAQISRMPLTESDIKMSVDTAVNLHSRALEHRKNKRWRPLLVSAGAALTGSLIGTAFPYFFHHQHFLSARIRKNTRVSKRAAHITV